MRYYLAMPLILLLATAGATAQNPKKICRNPSIGNTDHQCPDPAKCTPTPVECLNNPEDTPCLNGGQVCKITCTFRIGTEGCCECRTKNLCTVSVTDPNNLTVSVHDPFDGLQSVGVHIAKNLTVTISSFSAGTFDPVTVTGTKVDPSLTSRLELNVCTPTYCRLCDPVITLVTRDRGKPEFETFFGVPEAEGFVTVRNGAPGLDNLLIVVNGERFRVNGLNDDEQHTLDVSFAMIPGDNNIIEFQALGKPGAHATVVVHD